MHLENSGNNSLAWEVPGMEARGMPRAGVRAVPWAATLPTQVFPVQETLKSPVQRGGALSAPH